jgi:hypothetical protein
VALLDNHPNPSAEIHGGLGFNVTPLLNQSSHPQYKGKEYYNVQTRFGTRIFTEQTTLTNKKMQWLSSAI